MVSSPVAVLLVVISSIIWGSCRGFVKNASGDKNAKSLPILCMQHITQIIVALLIALPQVETFDNKFGENKFFAIFFAGVFSILAEFLYISSTSHLTSTVSKFFSSVYSDVFVSIILYKFYKDTPVRISILIVVAVFYFSGLIFLSWAEIEHIRDRNELDDSKVITIKRKKRKKEKKKGKDIKALPNAQKDIAPDTATTAIPIELVEKGLGTESIEEDRESSISESELEFGVSFQDFDLDKEFGAPNPIYNHMPVEEPKNQTNSILMINITEIFFRTSGIFIALVSSICVSLFFILSTAAIHDKGALTDWATTFLFAQFGKFAALPFCLFFFGFWDPLKIFPDGEKLSHLHDLFDLNPKRFYLSITVGCLLSGSFALIYYASTAVPFCIINGILICQTVIALAWTLFVWKDFAGLGLKYDEYFVEHLTPVGWKLLMGVIFYVAALLLLTLAAYRP